MKKLLTVLSALALLASCRPASEKSLALTSCEGYLDSCVNFAGHALLKNVSEDGVELKLCIGMELLTPCNPYQMLKEDDEMPIEVTVFDEAGQQLGCSFSAIDDLEDFLSGVPGEKSELVLSATSVMDEKQARDFMKKACTCKLVSVEAMPVEKLIVCSDLKTDGALELENGVLLSNPASDKYDLRLSFVLRCTDTMYKWLPAEEPLFVVKLMNAAGDVVLSISTDSEEDDLKRMNDLALGDEGRTEEFTATLSRKLKFTSPEKVRAFLEKIDHCEIEAVFAPALDKKTYEELTAEAAPEATEDEAEQFGM